jgi:8-oxo-dGTP pyrophosphatase MutT (NUDIX family)
MIDRGQVTKRHVVKRSFRESYRVKAAYPFGMDDQPIRDASTVCVVRPGGAGLEVLMVRRAASSVFVGGAHVFPGGALDAVDRSETARRLFGDGPLSAWLSAAVRETAEEAGLVVPAGQIETPRRTHGMELLRALDEAGYVFDPSRFAYLSNWVTPKGQPRRFDTKFFVTDAQEQTQASPDATEVTETVWVTPRSALERWSRGEWMLVRPTLETLRTLAGFDEADAVLSFARSQRSIPRIEPRVVQQDGALKILMPGDAGYEQADT